jgi:hypothetical protein
VQARLSGQPAAGSQQPVDRPSSPVIPSLSKNLSSWVRLRRVNSRTIDERTHDFARDDRIEMRSFSTMPFIQEIPLTLHLFLQGMMRQTTPRRNVG